MNTNNSNSSGSSISRSSFNELLSEEKRRLHELENLINELEHGDGNDYEGSYTVYDSKNKTSLRSRNVSSLTSTSLPTTSSQTSLFDIQSLLNDIVQRLKDYEKLIDKESKTHRYDMKRRLQHLLHTSDNLTRSLEFYKKKKFVKNYNLQKSELFGKNQSDAIDPELHDLEMAENNSLTNTNQMLNHYISTSKETLSELYSQKERLKGIQTKVLDILSLLGISNTIMKSVEKRDLFDKYLVFGGMIVTLLILALVIFYLRK